MFKSKNFLMMFILLTDVAMSTTVAKDSTTTQSPTESGMHAIITHAVDLYIGYKDTDIHLGVYMHAYINVHACLCMPACARICKNTSCCFSQLYIYIQV